MNRLITIPFSHYCEKARWALDLASQAGVTYREEGHLPLLSRAFTKPLQARTVPVFVTEREVLRDSTDILAWVDQKVALYPSAPAARAASLALEEDLDQGFGPHVRRLAYFHLLGARQALDAVLSTSGVATWELRMVKVTRPAVIAVMKKGLKITPDGAARSEVKVRATFERVSALLADHPEHPYLGGEAFGATDLTFASLASPLLMPPEHPLGWPDRALMPPAFTALVDELSATRAGAHALRCYRELRRATLPPRT